MRSKRGRPATLRTTARTSQFTQASEDRIGCINDKGGAGREPAAKQIIKTHGRNAMPDAMVARASEANNSSTAQQVDVAVIGTGFAGLYTLYRLRKAGFTAVGLDEADDVGGTWYWNRYPGARCDIQTIDYSYTFDPELEQAWTWSEKYATQPEILRYLGFVADRYDLRRDIRFATRVKAANWDEASQRWQLATDNGANISC